MNNAIPPNAHSDAELSGAPSPIEISEGADMLVVGRPHWMDEQRWRQIKDDATDFIEARVDRLRASGRVSCYSWRDLAATDAHLDRFHRAEADRDALPLGSQDLRHDFRTSPQHGGLIAWNLTKDEDTGLLVMLTGQTPEQERQVMENAAWLVSCGAVYPAARVGKKGWKTSYDDRVEVDGDELLVWVLPNDTDIHEGMRRR